MGEAVYCASCEMWLNGQRQWEDHKLGKKHRRSLKGRKSQDARMNEAAGSAACQIASQAPKVCIERKGTGEWVYAMSGESVEQSTSADTQDVAEYRAAAAKNVGLMQVSVVTN